MKPHFQSVFTLLKDRMALYIRAIFQNIMVPFAARHLPYLDAHRKHAMARAFLASPHFFRMIQPVQAAVAQQKYIDQ